MSNIKFNIKEESINEFFNERLLNHNPVQTLRGSQNPDDRLDPYYFIKENLFIRKDKDLIEGDKIKIELPDKACKSFHELTNTFVYEVKEYDDVSYALKLIESKVESAD